MAPERRRRKAKDFAPRFIDNVKPDLRIGDAAANSNLIAAIRQAEPRDARIAVDESTTRQEGSNEGAVAR